MSQSLSQALQKANQLVQAEANKLLIWRELLIILQGIIPGFVLVGYAPVNEMDEHTADEWDNETFDDFGTKAIAECESRM